MNEKHIKSILMVTGLITMLPVVQFFAPDWMLQQQSLTVSDDAGRLFARHWGLVVLLLMNWSNPALQGLHMVALFDALCVVLYAIYLFGGGKTSDAKPD
jgi:hypothetical protein